MYGDFTLAVFFFRFLRRLTLYLCKKTAILDALFLKSYNSDESDADLPTYEEV